jgi:hypothetical protein
MFKHLLSLRTRQAPRDSLGLADHRAGAPVRRGPAPMPRMRWYS